MPEGTLLEQYRDVMPEMEKLLKRGIELTFPDGQFVRPGNDDLIYGKDGRELGYTAPHDLVYILADKTFSATK